MLRIILLLLLLLLPLLNFGAARRATPFQQQQQQQQQQLLQQELLHAYRGRRPRYSSSRRTSSSSGSSRSKGQAFIDGRSLPSSTPAAAAAAAAGRAAANGLGVQAAVHGPPCRRAAVAGGAGQAAGTAAASAASAAASAAAAAAAAAAVGEEPDLGTRVRPLFPLLAARKRIVPFDNAATTHKPRCVINAEAAVYRQLNANIHRGSYRLAVAATEAVENAREKVARFVGGEPEEIVFTGGATAGINMVARAWGDAYVEEGSEILVSVAEHHANLVPWQQLAKRRKAKLRFIPLESGSRKLDVHRALSLLSSRTRVLAVACVSNVLGAFVQQQQLKQLLLRAKAQQQKLITLLDATQAVQHAKVDARGLGADLLVASGHKMYGGTGVGFLWGRKEILQQMPPDNLGGEMIQHVQLSGSEFAAPPWRFEAGTLPIAQIVGLGAAIDFISDIGLSTIAAADKRLSHLLLQAVSDLPRARILSVLPSQQQQQQQQKGAAAATGAAAAEEETVPICSFVVEGLSPFDLAVCADQWHHIHLRAGHHCAQPLHEEVLGVPGSLRASLAIYNTEEEIFRFHQAMLKTIKQLDAIAGRASFPKPAAAAAAAAAPAAAAVGEAGLSAAAAAPAAKAA
ncbi:hypothetical protein Efla_000824 [Eimeria flavescens]